MAYRFTGFLAKSPTHPTADVGTVWRNITTPFVGVGVRLESLLGESLPPDIVRTLAEQFAFTPATDWLFLNYVTWAGRIDSVYGLGVCGGREFGPVEEDNADRTRDAFLRLMSTFGVSADDALRFPPFERGFWGER